MKTHAFHKSIAWVKSYKLALDIYKITENFPAEEKYGLTSQIKRCSISIPSNISEGLLRNSPKELARFLVIAKGSCGELLTQLNLATDLNYLKNNTLEIVQEQIIEIIKILTSSIKTLNTRY